jgi:hypothetical protein
MGQHTDSLRGTVRDQNGDAVAGARVILQAGDQSGALTAATDREGVFEFRGLTGREYTLSVVAQGFADIRQTVQPGSQAEIVLSVGNPQLTVSAEVGSYELKENVPQPVNIISAAALIQRASSVLAQAATESLLRSGTGGDRRAWPELSKDEPDPWCHRDPRVNRQECRQLCGRRQIHARRAARWYQHVL